MVRIYVIANYDYKTNIEKIVLPLERLFAKLGLANVVIVDHHFMSTYEAPLPQNSLIILSYIPVPEIVNRECVLVADSGEIVDLPNVPDGAFFDHHTRAPATFHIRSRGRIIPINVYRCPGGSYVAVTNDITHFSDSVSENYRLAFIMVLEKILEYVAADKANRSLKPPFAFGDGLMATRIASLVLAKKQLAPIERVIVENNDEYTAYMSIGDRIRLTIDMKKVAIPGYRYRDKQYLCEAKPVMIGKIIVEWMPSGSTARLEASDLRVLFDGNYFDHENIDGADVCLGTYSIPNLNFGEPVDRQIRRIAREIVEVLRWPNVSSAYHRGIGDWLRHNASCQEISDWEA